MLRARDIMNPKYITVPSSMTIGDLADILQRAHIHAAPVLAEGGDLIGIVTLEDVLYGTMGGDREENGTSTRIESRSGLLEIEQLDSLVPDNLDLWSRPVTEIMTDPAITVEGDTPLVEACRLLWSLRIHHLPVVEQGRLVGIISSLDLCRAISEGQIGA